MGRRSWQPAVWGAESLLCLFPVQAEERSLQLSHPVPGFPGQRIHGSSRSEAPRLCSAPLQRGVSVALLSLSFL